MNLIGRGNVQGDIERMLNVQFDGGQRYLVDQAFEQLKSAGLIRPTYTDLIDPVSWVEITDPGRDALARKCLDDLDAALYRVGAHLVEVREGAWSALASGNPDSLRQASHSARELIDQTLKEGAPDAMIRHMPNFAADPTSTSGITRKHRLKYLMASFRGRISESDLRLIEKAYELLEVTNTRLTAASHTRDALDTQNVRDMLTLAETMLRCVLLNGPAPSNPPLNECSHEQST